MRGAPSLLSVGHFGQEGGEQLNYNKMLIKRTNIINFSTLFRFQFQHLFRTCQRMNFKYFPLLLGKIYTYVGTFSKIF